MTTKQPDIVFVYKAESGLINLLKDAVHKTFSPATYPCRLCDITYSPIGMRRRWKQFVTSLPYRVEFSYIDLIEDALPDDAHEYPCAFWRKDKKLTLWLSAKQINACDTLDDLIALVNISLPDAPTGKSSVRA